MPSAQKPWPELPALAFQDLRPGQSHVQAMTLAWPGLAQPNQAQLGLAHGFGLGREHHYSCTFACARLTTSHSQACERASVTKYQYVLTQTSQIIVVAPAGTWLYVCILLNSLQSKDAYYFG